MSLKSLADPKQVDKDTNHSYLDLYDRILDLKKYTAKNVLEVGVDKGGSIRLWRKYFIHAQVYGLDCIPLKDMPEDLKADKKVTLFTSINAYDEKFFNENLLDKKHQFDFVLDDGPHSLDSMVAFITLYSQLLNDEGVLIIEDIQSWDWIEPLKSSVPDHLKLFVQAYDLRPIKNRWDDIVLVINKGLAPKGNFLSEKKVDSS